METDERDITLAEIAEHLKVERGVKAGVTTVHEFFAKRGVTGLPAPPRSIRVDPKTGSAISARCDGQEFASCQVQVRLKSGSDQLCAVYSVIWTGWEELIRVI